MKTNLINVIKLVLADRLVAALLVMLIVLAAAYSLYVGLSLQASDIQVAVHYTAYGDTNFYRDKWYYFFSFVGFGAIVAVIHTAIALKLYALERRQLAIYFIGLSFLMLVIAWAVTHAILGVAFL